jgi:hypothetical protein
MANSFSRLTEICMCHKLTESALEQILLSSCFLMNTRKYRSAGLRPKSDCSGKAQKQLYSKLQTRPLVREGATK